MSPLLVLLVAVALLFDFLNGLHDSANSIATVVSTRVLRPAVAVFWAAFFNFIAFLVFGLHVADTMGKGLVVSGVLDSAVVFGALTGAIAWNVITWVFGIPSSSSHALVGGIVGAAMAKAGPAAVIWSALETIGAAIVLSPLIGFVLATALFIGATWLSVRSTPFAADKHFRFLQFISSSLLSLGHGGNDAQKTMGIIAGLLFSEGALQGDFYVPLWVVLSCQAALALGTFSGGWRIVRTVGTRITDLKPIQGFCAETAGAATLFGATWLGIPISTTHTVIGSIVGSGAIRRASAVRWGVAKTIVWAWVVTLPASALVGAVGYGVAMLFEL
jgi:PiT family inorganic phosphate transporter